MCCVRVNLINCLSSPFKYSRNKSVSGSKKPAWIDDDVTSTTIESASITVCPENTKNSCVEILWNKEYICSVVSALKRRTQSRCDLNNLDFLRHKFNWASIWNWIKELAFKQHSELLLKPSATGWFNDWLCLRMCLKGPCQLVKTFYMLYSYISRF